MFSHELIREVPIAEIRKELDRPRRTRNSQYRPKRWYEFWAFEQPEFFEGDESVIAGIAALVQAYDEGGGRVYEYTSSEESWASLAGEAGYVLLRGDEAVAKVITLQS